MNCFVLRVDGAWGVGRCLLSVTVLGQVGGAPGLRGRPRVADVGAGRSTIALLHMHTSRGAELFHLGGYCYWL